MGLCNAIFPVLSLGSFSLQTRGTECSVGFSQLSINRNFYDYVLGYIVKHHKSWKFNPLQESFSCNCVIQTSHVGHGIASTFHCELWLVSGLTRTYVSHWLVYIIYKEVFTSDCHIDLLIFSKSNSLIWIQNQKIRM